MYPQIDMEFLNSDCQLWEKFTKTPSRGYLFPATYLVPAIKDMKLKCPNYETAVVLLLVKFGNSLESFTVKNYVDFEKDLARYLRSRVYLG